MTEPTMKAKPAPEAVLVDDDAYLDPSKALVALATRELGEKAEGMHFCLFCGDTYKPDLLKRRGYVPAMEPTRPGQSAKQYMDDKGQGLWMIPESVHVPRRQRPAREAASRLRDVLDGASADFPDVRPATA